MKHFLSLIILCGMSAAMADEAATPEPNAPVVAAAPQLAASAVDASIPVPTEVVVREGRVFKMQECSPNGGAGRHWGNILSLAVLQISKKTGADLVAQTVGADVVGNVAGGAAEPEADKRKVCVTVAFKDGTPDQVAVLPGKTYDTVKPRYRQTVAVRFEDGKPVFPW